MKRLIIFIFLSILLFNRIGYQFPVAGTDQENCQKPASTTTKMPAFHIALYEKEIDFDDLLEFTSCRDYSANEIIFSLSDDLYSEPPTKENHRTTFKCFNGEYYSRLDKLFIKYPDDYLSGKIPDRYLLNISEVFISPKDHPPQTVG